MSSATGFKGFLARLKDPSSVNLLSELNTTIEQFNDAPFAEGEEEKLVGAAGGGGDGGALGRLERRMASSAQWKASPEALEDGREGLEKYVMTKVYGRAWQASPAEEAHSARLDAKVSRLGELLRPEHLDIPDNFRGHSERWDTALAALRDLNKYKAPRDKLVCVHNCCRVVNMHLREAADRAAAAAAAAGGGGNGALGQSISADDFLPAFIFVVVHARVPHLYSNVHYIMRYRHPSRMVGEAAYHLTNLSSVLAFLENCGAGDFSQCGEYDAHMGPELGGRLAADGGGAASGGGSSTGEGGGGDAATEAAVSAVALPHTLVDHDVADLRVGDVPQLLAEYKRLARAFDLLTAAPAAAADDGSAS